MSGTGGVLSLTLVCVQALVKAMLKGWDLSDVMVALSTTGMCKQKGGCSQPCSDFGCEPHITPNGMCLHPGCPIEHSGEDKSQIEMSADEYNKFKRMGGSRWSSFWKQRGGSGGNRRTDLGVAVRTALECAYEKLAVDNIAMQSTPHWRCCTRSYVVFELCYMIVCVIRYFGDLKPDNFRWATAPGDSVEKVLSPKPVCILIWLLCAALCDGHHTV